MSPASRLYRRLPSDRSHSIATLSCHTPPHPSISAAAAAANARQPWTPPCQLLCTPQGCRGSRSSQAEPAWLEPRQGSPPVGTAVHPIL